MTATLQMAQHHDTTEVTDVERIGRGVSTEVCRNHLPLQKLFRTGHYLREHTTPFQFFNKVFCHCIYRFFCYAILSDIEKVQTNWHFTAQDHNRDRPTDDNVKYVSIQAKHLSADHISQ